MLLKPLSVQDRELQLVSSVHHLLARSACTSPPLCADTKAVLVRHSRPELSIHFRADTDGLLTPDNENPAPLIHQLSCVAMHRHQGSAGNKETKLSVHLEPTLAACSPQIAPALNGATTICVSAELCGCAQPSRRCWTSIRRPSSAHTSAVISSLLTSESKGPGPGPSHCTAEQHVRAQATRQYWTSTRRPSSVCASGQHEPLTDL